MNKIMIACVPLMFMGCASDSEWIVSDEVDWSVPDLPIQDFTWFPSDLPVVDNRVHLFRTGTPSMIQVSFWDGAQWLATDFPVLVPENWYIGPDPCCIVEEIDVKSVDGFDG